MKIAKYDIVNIQAYKHNGKLGNQWNGAIVIAITSNYIILFLSKTKVMRSSKQHWVIREPTLWFFPLKQHFFNTTILIRDHQYYFYTNLASPVIYEDQTLKYIDYDLDIKHYPNRGVKLVDEKEFKQNAERWKYPPELIRKIFLTVREVNELIHQRKSIFNKEIVDGYLKWLTHHHYIK